MPAHYTTIIFVAAGLRYKAIYKRPLRAIGGAFIPQIELSKAVSAAEMAAPDCGGRGAGLGNRHRTMVPPARDRHVADVEPRITPIGLYCAGRSTRHPRADNLHAKAVRAFASLGPDAYLIERPRAAAAEDTAQDAGVMPR